MKLQYVFDSENDMIEYVKNNPELLKKIPDENNYEILINRMNELDYFGLFKYFLQRTELNETMDKYIKLSETLTTQLKQQYKKDEVTPVEILEKVYNTLNMVNKLDEEI